MPVDGIDAVESSSTVLPSYNEKKYDRQLRLWASTGQQALENSHILLVGATSTGCELIKNLILPGIGRVTIFDNSIVDDEAIRGNFFLTEDDIGKSKGESVAKLLNELNPQMECKGLEVVGELFTEAAISSIDLTQFNLVVASGVGPSVLSVLDSTLRSVNIPLIIADSVGFYGYLRVGLPSDHTIIESHPDSLVDLRLDSPWEELVEYCQKFDKLDQFSPTDIEHVPFIILLINLLKKWQQLHQKEPSTYEEKKEFKKFILQSAKDSAKGNGDFENFEEAVSAVFKLFQSSKTLPSEIEKILYHENTKKKLNKSQFWTLVAALRIFYEEKDAFNRPRQLLPLSGVLPDMKTSTEWFVELQTIYKQKAEQDVESIKRILESITTTFEVPLTISSEYITSFCKNSRYIRAYSGSPLEYTNSEVDNSSIQKEDFDIYLAIRAYKAYQEKHAGVAPTPADDLSAEMQSILTSSFPRSSTTASAIRVSEELTRVSGELYNIASFIGGIGAQEAVKIITQQYIPLNNTLVYDGIISRTGSFTL